MGVKKEWSALDAIREQSPDWPIKPLNAFARKEKNSFVNGPFGSDLLSTEHQDAGVPVVYIRDIERGRYRRKSTVFVSHEKAADLAACATSPGDLIVAKVGTPPCEAAIYDASEDAVVTQDVIRLKTHSHQQSLFLAQLLNSDIGRRQVTRIKIAGTRERVSLTDLKKIPLPFPPMDVQEDIANLLATWDRAIETTESLHRNSVALKKAMLNSLVEGRSRLKRLGKAASDSGTPLGWKTVYLGKVGRCITGLTYSPQDVVDSGGLLVLRSSNISENEITLYDRVYVTAPVPEESLTKVGDILVAVRNGSRNLIGKNAVIGNSAAGMAHGAFMTLYRSDESDYVSHLFQSEMFFRQVNRNLGATINSINISHLNKFRFPFPPKEERSAIASVLTASSREIATLRSYLACLRSEKDALMQQLLTGRRRVRFDKEAAPIVVNG